MVNEVAKRKGRQMSDATQALYWEGRIVKERGPMKRAKFETTIVCECWTVQLCSSLLLIACSKDAWWGFVGTKKSKKLFERGFARFGAGLACAQP